MKAITVLALILAGPFLLTGCSHLQASDFGHYSRAEKYYAQGKFHDAISEYDAYLNKEPQGNMAIVAHYYTAKSRAALGDTAGAKADFENIIKQYPQSDWARFSKDRLRELAEKT